MTKPQVVEPKQLNHMLLAVAGDGKTKGYSQYPIRDKALLLVLYGTGMTATELATLPVRAYLTPAGAIKTNSMRAQGSSAAFEFGPGLRPAS